MHISLGHTRRFLQVSAFLIAIAAATVSMADVGDPPSRVARLAYTQGAVSLQPAGTDDWVDAPLNRPLTIGDKMWSDDNARVELQLDGSLLRMSSDTSISILNLDDNVTQIQLSQGTLLVRVRRLDDNETYEIDTPNLAFSVLRTGLYRVRADASGNTIVRVDDGQAEATGGGSAYTLRAHETNVFSGDDVLSQNAQNYSPNEDDFDYWSSERDNRFANSPSAGFVSPDVVGYEDLDANGSWSTTPEYEHVWFPRSVEAGWAPYHSGHWSYIAPWGYTWVDDQPWGFAPFHYGRWVSIHGNWGWIPSPPRSYNAVYVRPVYAPALVAWVGAGTGVAWFPLGPREVYVPSYPVSHRYVNNINVSNTRVNTTVVNNVYNTTIINNRTVNVTNINYANRNVPGAVAATTTQAFSTAQPVSRNFVRLDGSQIRAGRVQAVAPPVVPTKQGVLGAQRDASARPPAAIQTRSIVARTAPPAAPPSFENRQAVIRQNGGRPLSMSQVRTIQPSARPSEAPVRVVPPVAPVAARPQQQQPPQPQLPSQQAAEQERGRQQQTEATRQSHQEQQRQQQQQQQASQNAERQQAMQQQQQRVQQQRNAEQAQQQKQQADAARQSQQEQQRQQQQASQNAERQQAMQQQQQQQRVQQQRNAEQAQQQKQQADAARQSQQEQQRQQQQASQNAERQQATQLQQLRAQQAAEQQRVQQQRNAEQAQQQKQQADAARQSQQEQQRQQQQQQQQASQNAERQQAMQQQQLRAQQAAEQQRAQQQQQAAQNAERQQAQQQQQQVREQQAKQQADKNKAANRNSEPPRP